MTITQSINYLNYLLNSRDYLHIDNYNNICENLLIHLNRENQKEYYLKNNPTHIIHKTLLNFELEFEIIKASSYLKIQKFENKYEKDIISIFNKIYNKKTYHSTFLNKSNLSRKKVVPKLNNTDLSAFILFSIKQILDNKPIICHETKFRIYNLLKRQINFPENMVTNYSNDRIDIKSENELIRLVDHLILAQRVSTKNSNNFLISKEILNLLNSIRSNKSKIKTFVETPFGISSTYLKFVSAGVIRNNNKKNPELNSFENDGSHGENNFKEYGRYTSGASYDRYDDEAEA